MRNRHPTSGVPEITATSIMQSGNRVRRLLIRIESSLSAQRFDQMSGLSGIS
jgi:hypothetical protein